MSDAAFGVGPDYQIPDALWAQMVRVLPPPRARKKDGRPRMADRQAMTAILSVLRTGCQWKALPRSLGAASMVQDRFQEWREAKVFAQLWQAGLLLYDELKGLEWEWQAMDGTMTKAPLGGKRHGPQPYRPRQIGDETQSVDGRRRHSPGSRRGRRQSP
jgi:putative transposase